ncbi:MAG: hypothetical protein ACKV2V_10370 [Blastocatellia bacterium]
MVTQRYNNKIHALTLMAAVLLALSTMSLASPAPTSTKFTGRLLVSGQVTVNGVAAAPGVTAMDRTRIRTGSDGLAIVSVAGRGRIEIRPNSDMTLRLSDKTIGGSLVSGEALVSASRGTAVSVNTARGTAVTDGAGESVMLARYEESAPRFAVARSSARVSAGARTEILRPGQEAALSAVEGVGADRSIRISDVTAGVSRELSGNRVSTPEGDVGDLVRTSADRTTGLAGRSPRTTSGRENANRDKVTGRIPPDGVSARRVQDVSRIIP